jgi:hypothetical protein
MSEILDGEEKVTEPVVAKPVSTTTSKVKAAATTMLAMIVTWGASEVADQKILEGKLDKALLDEKRIEIVAAHEKVEFDSISVKGDTIGKKVIAIPEYRKSAMGKYTYKPTAKRNIQVMATIDGDSILYVCDLEVDTGTIFVLKPQVKIDTDADTTGTVISEVK